MKIIIKKTLDVTPALEEHIDAKLLPLSKFLGSFEKDGEVELWLEVARATNRPNKGEEVFKAIADLKLPGKILRSEASASDIYKAIDEVRNVLHMEIEKYKEKRSRPQRENK